MSQETIGRAMKSADAAELSDSVNFQVPYGDSEYTVILANQELDKLLDNGYAELMGRQALIGNGFQIELESPDLPLFAYTISFHMEKEQGCSPAVNMGVGIVTQSVVNEHRGILLARRHSMDGLWEFKEYEIQPPLRDPEEILGYADELNSMLH